MYSYDTDVQLNTPFYENLNSAKYNLNINITSIVSFFKDSLKWQFYNIMWFTVYIDYCVSMHAYAFDIVSNTEWSVIWDGHWGYLYEAPWFEYILRTKTATLYTRVNQKIRKLFS